MEPRSWLPILLAAALLATACPSTETPGDDDDAADDDAGDDDAADDDGGDDDGGDDDTAAGPCFDTLEVELHAAQAYDAAGHPNPFTEVSLTATVEAPDGGTVEIDGFFDGDGAGGAVGDVFKLRIFADQCGTWTWTAHSPDAGLDGQSGQETCQGTFAGAFGDGPVEVHPAHPRAFRYREGDAVYLVGKFLDVAAPAPIQFSHTLLSEELSDGDRQAMLDRHVGMHLNKMNVYLANVGDYGGVSTTPWLGSASSNDKSRFDLARWHTYDHWVQELGDAGLVAQLWFFADDSGFGDLADADRQRLIEYGMARHSAYVNTMFTLCLEWQEGWSNGEVETHAEHIQQHNPWDRLVSVHGTTGDFSYPGSAWADYMDIQSGNSADHGTVHAMGLSNRALAAKPLINEEFGMGDEDTAHRQKAWAAFTAGGAGSGTGGFLQHLADFTAAVPFERMEPADHLVTGGQVYCLAEVGYEYVLYLPGGGAVDVDLVAMEDKLLADWFDPRTGSTTSAGIVHGSGVATLSAPDGNDWVLHLH